MKRLNTNAVTSDIGLVLQHKHLDFIQDKTEESLIHSIYSQLGGVNTGVVILYGCIPTFTTTTTLNDTLTITAGAISYQGKIYEVSASTQVKTGSAVHLLKIYAPSYDASDPSLFTDGVSRNVQEIRVAALSVGATGSGISDWSSVMFMDTGWIPLTLNAGWIPDSGTARPPSYRLKNNIIYLEGTVVAPTVGTSTNISTIPYLPIQNVFFSTPKSEGAYGNTTSIVSLVGRLETLPFGGTTPTSPFAVYLDGVSYSIT